MKNSVNTRRLSVSTCVVLVALFAISQRAVAAPWGGIEPFKSRRADVIKILGEPASESSDGVLHFKVMGGSVQISFVSERFTTVKRLRPELAGTVLEIMLQHDQSSETPDSMKLAENRLFTKDETENSLIFRNLRDGIVYTFTQGRLRTTRYTFADEQLGRARKY